MRTHRPATKTLPERRITKSGALDKRFTPNPLAPRVSETSIRALKENRHVTTPRTELTASQVEYLEWLLTPKDERSPSTQEEEAAVLGVSAHTLRRWRKEDGLFREKWEEALRDTHLSPDTQQTLMERLLKIARNGNDRDAIQAIGMYQKIVGQMAPERHVHEFDPSKLTDEELVRLTENVTVLRDRSA
jgi:hypothetical protein